MKSLLTIAILLMCSVLISAQSIFDISLKNINTDQAVSLKDYHTSKGIVIIFISTKCPYGKYYESRIQKMVQEYGNKGMSFLMVNANSAESIDKMKDQAKYLNSPYLLDVSKELTNFLGAKKSPETFLLKGNGKVYYKGAIDDNPQVASDVRVNYLREAIDGLLEGKPSASSNNRPIGCIIK